jgi:hypothetical protein
MVAIPGLDNPYPTVLVERDARGFECALHFRDCRRRDNLILCFKLRNRRRADARFN